GVQTCALPIYPGGGTALTDRGNAPAPHPETGTRSPPAEQRPRSRADLRASPASPRSTPIARQPLQHEEQPIRRPGASDFPAQRPRTTGSATTTAPPVVPEDEDAAPGNGSGVERVREGPDQRSAIFFCRCSSSAARNSSVVSHCWSLPTSSARSLVILPLSTVSMTTFSRVSAKPTTSGVESSLPRCCKPRVQAKIEAIGLVEVGLPCWCCR